MFWNKNKKLKESREKEYFELNKMFKNKHQIVANWYMKKYLCNNNGLQPVTEDGFSYQKRIIEFFNYQYGKLPHSYNLYASVNIYHNEDFDYFPVEKLQDLYNQIEIFFPEPFLNTRRKLKLKKLDDN